MWLHPTWSQALEAALTSRWDKHSPFLAVISSVICAEGNWKRLRLLCHCCRAAGHHENRQLWGRFGSSKSSAGTQELCKSRRSHHCSGHTAVLSHPNALRSHPPLVVKAQKSQGKAALWGQGGVEAMSWYAFVFQIH